MNAARAVVSVLLLAVGAMLVAGPVGAVDCLRPVGKLPEGLALAVDMEAPWPPSAAAGCWCSSTSAIPPTRSSSAAAE